MKIAIIGSGISGMAAAHYLHQQHEVHLFEAGPRLGGHTATIEVEDGKQTLAIDTGFIVYNDWTYPEFIKLLDKLQVPTQATQMSFSVSDAVSGLEYAGTNLNTLFAQRRNVVSPRYWRLLRDIVRFNSQVEQHLQAVPGLAEATLGAYLREFKYSTEFHDLYLMPMGAAIWSTDTGRMEDFPLHFFVRFFRNHGLLNLQNRPQWRVIKGGSSAYIAPLTAGFQRNIRLNTPVLNIHRQQASNGRSQVLVTTKGGLEFFDQVVIACHSNQALALLADPSPDETAILGAIPYLKNEVALHTDTQLLPRNRRAWSSWNVSVGRGAGNVEAQGNAHRQLDSSVDLPTLTYNMNILQGLTSDKTWCVTLNQTQQIRQERIHSVYHYEHPLFTLAGIQAQQRWAEINGVNNTWFCGAWWRNGFHEDGVWSAKRVADTIAAQVAQRPPRQESASLTAFALAS